MRIRQWSVDSKVSIPFPSIMYPKNKNSLKRHCGSYKELNGIPAFFMLVGFLFFQFLYIMKFRPIPVYFGRSGLFRVISAGINFGFLFPFWTDLFWLLAGSKLKATLFLLHLGLNSKYKITASPMALFLSLKVSRKEISSSIFWREFCTSRGTLWSWL